MIVEANPSYENLFGWIEYRQSPGLAPYRFPANPRRRAASRQWRRAWCCVPKRSPPIPQSWAFLKGALRDRVIRIEELGRAQSPPIAGAPQPGPIPLDVKVVVVGTPFWYATFFQGDSDFRTYFKINADIDGDTPADARNLGLYAGLDQPGRRAARARWREQRCDRAAARHCVALGRAPRSPHRKGRTDRGSRRRSRDLGAARRQTHARCRDSSSPRITRAAAATRASKRAC